MTGREIHPGSTVRVRARYLNVALHILVFCVCGMALSCRLGPRILSDIGPFERSAGSGKDLPNAPAELVEAAFPCLGPTRTVFRHSVVPGGVFSREETWQAALQWPEVQRHYADVAILNLESKTLERDRHAYVSYKRNDQIYWTSYTVRIAAGETVLTDGVEEIRSRCGNRLSDVPQEPTLPEGEPLPDELAENELELSPLDVGPPVPSPMVFAAKSRFRLPLFWVPIAFGPGLGGHDHPNPPNPPPPPPPPPVPEWPSWMYLAIGVLFCLVGLEWKRRRDKKLAANVWR